MTVIHQSSAFTEGTNYTYDAAGNGVSRTDTFQPIGGSVTHSATNYGYDSIYELTQAVVNGATTESYTYDAVGNRLSSLGAPSYSYNNSNELTSIGKKTFSYDANGNTLTKTAPNGTTSYTWDFENRLTSVTRPKGSVLHYQYDPFGRRIFSDGTGRIFVYDGDNVTEDLDLTGKAVARYTDGLGIDEPLEETASGASSYYEADGLGSITSLTSASGSIANTYNYDSFGNQTASSATVSNRFFFTARENVAKTGLLYYRARYYDPQTGRFLSEDPIRFPGGANFYSYVRNGPPNMADPLGTVPDKPNPRLPTVPTGDAGCKFVREVYHEGPCKLCWYQCRGYGGPVLFPQAVGKPCPSIDPVTGLVQTNEIDPECGGRPCKDKRPQPETQPSPTVTKPQGGPVLPIVIIEILEDIGEALLGALAA